ncbi:3-isopropylmalate dehydratase small subunit [Truepera radiovictrix]|uniref:3-isopropylmalate dehydratase n=1 Tax=Truepera radiovictrix (strain DSM 17093 / CIP 108686 / LMG 22925 / RQ-24) TaxID=649638 RepID=D7CRY9_TRURR|nr:3-isopropylmalate dehydratase small subunit [Truepera radiovictrix]ADI15317.1 3-isopropylmalate dehydratase, small subunit [Truepera radiovictrix DSM 17093]WMT56132.1 3-isopropylmalate dehydratase small subunit [Truepera radiovictrix]
MALAPITRVTGRGVFVPGDDIDTDRIIPARFMKCVTFDGLGQYMFYDVRFHEDGTPKDHPLNDPRFAGASVLLSGENFGCGSSREHAPQAMYRFGIRAVVAESFAEIFFGNSVTLGMPCVTATRAQIAEMARLIETDPQTPVTVDVANSTVAVGERVFPVTVRESAREALTQGRWDPIAELLEADEAIRQTAARLPYL